MLDPTDEAIVDLWFNDLFPSIVLEQEIEGSNVREHPINELVELLATLNNNTKIYFDAIVFQSAKQQMVCTLCPLV